MPESSSPTPAPPSIPPQDVASAAAADAEAKRLAAPTALEKMLPTAVPAALTGGAAVTALSYGPFSSIVGYVLAGLAAVAALTAAVLGPRWARFAPDEDLPMTPQVAVLGLTFVGLAVLLIYAGPASLNLFVLLAVVFALAGYMALVWFAEIRGIYGYYKPVIKNERTIDGFVLGCDDLEKRARELHEKDGHTIQTIFRGFAYDTDAVWPRKGRAKTKKKALYRFMAMVCCLAWAMGATGACIQVALTGKPIRVLPTGVAPGLSPAAGHSNPSDSTSSIPAASPSQ